MNRTARLGPTPRPPRLSLGDLSITFLDGGQLWLDGGTMFGIIPKALWARSVEVDKDNRIPLATTCVLIEAAGKRLLVETGCGHVSKYSEKERGFFSLSEHWLLDSLAAAGIERESIDMVLLTHLHFDHAGGCTMADGRGGYVPTFPRAKYVVQRGEWNDARAGHAVMSGTYREENLGPLDRAGVLSLMEGAAQIAPGIELRPLSGHTRHQQGVVLTGGGETVVQPADLMPTSAHVGLRYNMAYDLLPYENMRNKEKLLLEVAGRSGTLLLGQDPTGPLWRPTREPGGRIILTSREIAV